MSPGERRRRKAKRQRQAAEYAKALAAVRAVGGCCGNCQHYERVPLPDREYRGKRHCSLDSDWEGYVMTRPEQACPRWKRTAQAQIK